MNQSSSTDIKSYLDQESLSICQFNAAHTAQISSHQRPIYGYYNKKLQSTLTCELIEPSLAYKTALMRLVLCQDTSCRTLNNVVCLWVVVSRIRNVVCYRYRLSVGFISDGRCQPHNGVPCIQCQADQPKGELGVRCRSQR